MTREDYFRKLNHIENVAKLQKAALLRQYAEENAKYKIGQIIRTHNNVIFRIDKVGAEHAMFSAKAPYIFYSGERMTQKLEPRKVFQRVHEFELYIKEVLR